MDYKKLISNGKSVREFLNKDIDSKNFNELEVYMNNSKKLLPEIDMEIQVFNNKNFYESLKNLIGYNGFLINAPNYVVILSEIKDKYIENSGFVGERLILKARDLGIDSCWITFKDSNIVKDKLGILSDKEVTAIIALGYEDDKNTKNKSGSERLSVEEIVYMNKWGENANLSELEERGIFEAFSYARMAPSTLNRQPWRFIIDGEKVILTVKKDDSISKYERSIETGIAMLYFSLIVDTTMFDLRWNLENIDKDYKIPDEYEFVGYCSI